MSIDLYAMRDSLKRSWTLIGAAILAMAGVIEAQFSLLKPLLGEKAYGVAYFFAVFLLAILRLRTLR